MIAANAPSGHPGHFLVTPESPRFTPYVKSLIILPISTIRTSDLDVRSQLLYPAELRARAGSVAVAWEFASRCRSHCHAHKPLTLSQASPLDPQSSASSPGGRPKSPPQPRWPSRRGPARTPYPEINIEYHPFSGHHRNAGGQWYLAVRSYPRPLKFLRAMT